MYRPHTNLEWLPGWDWTAFKDTEEYGIMALVKDLSMPRSTDTMWAVYDRSSGLIVAITTNGPHEIRQDLLGLTRNSTELWNLMMVSSRNVVHAA